MKLKMASRAVTNAVCVTRTVTRSFSFIPFIKAQTTINNKIVIEI